MLAVLGPFIQAHTSVGVVGHHHISSTTCKRSMPADCGLAGPHFAASASTGLHTNYLLNSAAWAALDATRYRSKKQYLCQLRLLVVDSSLQCCCCSFLMTVFTAQSCEAIKQDQEAGVYWTGRGSYIYVNGHACATIQHTTKFLNVLIHLIKAQQHPHCVLSRVVVFSRCAVLCCAVHTCCCLPAPYPHVQHVFVC